MKQMNTEEWFKIKRYPHIGLPITIKDYAWVRRYVNDVKQIKKHSFLPMVQKVLVQRKFRAAATATKNPSGKRLRVNGGLKIRDVSYYSHLDAQIFSKYNTVLNNQYSEYLAKQPFNSAVVGYRKIPLFEGAKGNKCNIEFAKTAFEFIHRKKEQKLSVIIADISSFFESLDHKILKRQWTKVLNFSTGRKEYNLPDDCYNVFKGLTRIKYVQAEQLLEAYGYTMLMNRKLPDSSGAEVVVRKKVNDIRFAKEKKAIAFCEKSEFLQNNLNLIISKNNPDGIPQGSPISATLANIYMLDFDANVFQAVSNAQGFYQRYSDDLIIVCDRNFEEQAIGLIRSEIAKVNLKIQPAKTKLFRFEEFHGKFSGFEIDEFSKSKKSNKPLEYLGFAYDGKTIFIKTSGFSKFYRTMKGAFEKKAAFARHGKNPDKSLFKAKLYKRFTYKGAGRRLIYQPIKNNPSQYQRTNKYDWGNYLSYIYKANETFKSLNDGNNRIRNQSRRFWKQFHILLKQHESTLIQP